MSSAIQRAEDTAPRSSVVGAPPRRAYKRGLVVCVAIAMGLSLAAAPQASALTKNTYSTSFSGPAAAPLTNPTAVAVDESTHDLYVSNSPVNERQTVTVNAIGGTFALAFKGQTTTVNGTGNTTDGSDEIPLPHSNGTFIPGEAISGPGIPPGTTIREVSFSGVQRLSAAAEATTTGVKLTANLPFNASANLVQNALTALSSIGNGNVEVTGANGGPYTVEFSGALGGADQPQITADASGLTGGTQTVQITTPRPGSSDADVEKFTPSGEFLLMFGKEVNKTTGADVCTAGEECQPGAPGTTPGAFIDPLYLAVDNSAGLGRRRLRRRLRHRPR